ncbi:MAG: hypothetical protein EU551_02730 [Promethearchaeota archaeon]|nr:MAG: hypothetical protein EU551_02730 [Candidatus Lokiarchaeota archaeon]
MYFKNFKNKGTFFMLLIVFQLFIPIPIIRNNFFGISPINYTTSGINGILDNKLTLSKKNSAFSYQQEWNRTWGTNADDTATSIISDNEGNIYICGYVGLPNPNITIRKYSPSGTLIWSKIWDSTYPDYARGVSIDTDNDIYVIGYYHNTTASQYNLLIIKYDSNGNQIWNLSWGNSIDAQGRAIALKNDNIYAVCSVPSYSSVEIVKFDSNKNEIWNISWDLGGSEQPYAIDIYQNVLYICGNTDSLGATTNPFVLKYTIDGVELGAYYWGGDISIDYGKNIAFDDNGNGYLTGMTTSHGIYSQDVFLTKMNTNIDYIWNRTWGDYGSDAGSGIFIDSMDKIYVAGNTDSYSLGDKDALILIYDSNGNQISYLTWGGTSDEYALDIIVLNNDIYICGSTGSFSIGGIDIFLIKYKAISNEDITTNNTVPSFLVIFVILGVVLLIIIKYKNKIRI